VDAVLAGRMEAQPALEEVLRQDLDLERDVPMTA
jgi:hypothetical protein